MTIRQLKELIKDVPDDYRVILDNGKCEADDLNEVVFAFTYKRHGKVEQPKVLVLQTKEDVDVKEEIESTVDYYLNEEKKTAKEIFAELNEQGFNRNDYMKCSQQVMNMFKYQGVFK